jgi:hypothetical protein
VVRQSVAEWTGVLMLLARTLLVRDVLPKLLGRLLALKVLVFLRSAEVLIVW